MSLSRPSAIFLACLVAAVPAVVQAQCADYGGSFGFLGAADLLDYGKDIAVEGDLAFVVSGVPCSGSVGRLDAFDVATVGEPGGGPVIIAGIELPGGPVMLAALGERAYVGTLAGELHVVDLSDPYAPSLVTTLQTGTPNDMAADSGLLFVATDAGLQIHDLVDPDAPVMIGGCAFAGAVKSVAISGELAFVVWGGAGDGGSALSVVDVSDPANPVVFNSIWSAALLSAVAVSGDRAYLGGGFRHRSFNGFLDVLDVSDPLNPVVEGSLDGLKLPINSLAVHGDAVYATAENPWYFYGCLYVVDASDARAMNLVHHEEMEFRPFNPTVADGIVYFCEDRLTGGLHFATAPSDVRPMALAKLPWSREFYSAALQGNFAYVTDSAPALRVVDLSSPTTPQVIGGVGTQSRGEVVEVQGDFAYVGYMTRSIDVVDVSNPQAPQVVASVPQAFGILDMVATGMWLYAVGWNGMWTIDISDPPSAVARGYLAVDGIAIAVEGNHAYVLDGYSLNVVDVADPAAPVPVGILETEAGRALAVSGHHAFVVDWRGVQIVDVVDPALPVEVGRIDGAGNLDAIGISIRDGIAYLASERMAVVDVRDPLQPAVIGQTETQLDAWPRDVTAGEQLVLVAGENLRVFPVQCSRRGRPAPFAMDRVPVVRVAPNPMRTETRLELYLDPAMLGAETNPVRVWIVDVAGRKVARLADGSFRAGRHLLRWDGRRDGDGRPAPAGVYWLRVAAAGMAPRTARIVKLGDE